MLRFFLFPATLSTLVMLIPKLLTLINDLETQKPK